MKYLIETKKCTALLMLLDVMAFSIDTDFNICFFLKLLQLKLKLVNFKLELLLKLLSLFFCTFLLLFVPKYIATHKCKPSDCKFSQMSLWESKEVY